VSEGTPVQSSDRIDRDKLWNNLMPAIASSFLTGVATLVVGWWVITQTLYQDMREMQDELQRVKVENIRLNLMLEGQYAETPEATIGQFLDALPRPAWCKYHDADLQLFRMLHINPRYEFEYGVTLERYRDRVDAELWPEDKANIFLDNDRKVFHERGTSVFSEPVTIRSGRAQREFWKFYLKTRTGMDLVCGIQVTE
jgi:hypothetical protein